MSFKELATAFGEAVIMTLDILTSSIQILGTLICLFFILLMIVIIL